MKLIHRLTLVFFIVLCFYPGPIWTNDLFIYCFGQAAYIDYRGGAPHYAMGIITEFAILCGLGLTFLVWRLLWRICHWVGTGEWWDPGELLFKR